MSEQNMTAVRACFEQASRGNFAALDAIVTPDFVLHSPDEVRGADGLARMVDGYRRALPDLELTVDHQFAAGEYVASRFTIRGTHRAISWACRRADVRWCSPASRSAAAGTAGSPRNGS